MNQINGIGSYHELSNAHVESFVTYLHACGYAICKLPDKCSIAIKFVSWIKANKISVAEVNEEIVIEYLKSSVKLSKYRLAFKRVLLLKFIEYLRDTAVVPHPQLDKTQHSPVKKLELEYEDYLRDEKGLAHRSLLVYLPFVQIFLNACETENGSLYLEDLNAEIVRAFVLDSIENRSNEHARLLNAALRSFLHFLFLRKKTTIDLSFSLAPIRKPRGLDIHPFLSPEQVNQVLSTPDLTTPKGRRDHAIMLLLARLGLRAGEVVALELQDILWRKGELIIRGKGGTQDRIPLLDEVGQSLALYIESDRRQSKSRKVFLRCIAPILGLSGPATVGHIVRQAFVQAGIEHPSQVTTHLFRYSLATQMIRNGASLLEISKVLRHRCIETTELYAKVDFESLRQVAGQWPKGEGIQ